MDEEQYEEIARDRLSDKRSQYSVNVAKVAQELAALNGVDLKKARSTGILHDITKKAPSEGQLKIMDASGIMLTDVECCAPKPWHAMAGAACLRCALGVENQGILDAVRYHITGRANMPLLEKTVLVADSISDERDYEGVQELREVACHGLQEAVMAGLILTIQDLSQNQKPIHSDSLVAYNAEIVSCGEK